MRHRFVVESLMAVMMMMGVCAAPLIGQESAIERIPVTVALVADIDHPSAQAMILRQVEGIPKDVILLPRRRANERRLGAALATLITARNVLGERAETLTRMPVDKRTGSQLLGRRTRRDIRALLAKLKRSEPTELFGVGLVRNVTIWIPANPSVSVGPAGAGPQ